MSDFLILAWDRDLRLSEIGTRELMAIALEKLNILEANNIKSRGNADTDKTEEPGCRYCSILLLLFFDFP